MATDRTRRRMAALVRQWERSGEPRKAFARRHGLTVACFDYWKRRVRQKAIDKTSVAFAPVRVLADGMPRERGAIDVVLAGGERLTIRDGVSVEVLRAVVAALRASC